MNIAQIEAAINKLSKKINNKTFVYDFLLAYGTPTATITMLKNGSRNLSKKEGEIICKKKILFYANKGMDAEKVFEEIISEDGSFRHEPRFIVVTDFDKIYALDTKLHEKINFDLKDLPKKFDFFLPLAGIEKKEFQHENPVDVKAAEKLSKLFDLIKLNNPKSDKASLHALNVFLTRLLFCYFAEDTDIFPKGLFTKSIASHTQADGSDLSDYLKKLFAVMNIEERPKGMPDYIAAFPYVNGGLFATSYPIPVFCKRSRAALIDVGDLDWAEINPDIFGSMIQAVVHPDQRAGLGMHYTSVTNIMKVIEPLFLNDLYEEFEKSKKSENKLRKLLKRLSEIKFFDPACGSGNFLIIAYKELRMLEMLIYNELPNDLKFSYIPLRNFYGIEIDDFAHEVAILSLWLVEHQMDLVFTKEFGQVKASLPLKDGGNIYCGNSAVIDWKDVCDNSSSETYVLGNPPYLGFKMQTPDHKLDMSKVFEGEHDYKSLDYISCWFRKAAEYLNDSTSVGFVSTNSVCQGVQVELLWCKLLKFNIEIHFAVLPFKWVNNAKNNAGVTCIIIGLRKTSNKPKKIIQGKHIFTAKNINYYLVDAENIIVKQARDAISELPKISDGSGALDGGFLILTTEEKNELIEKNPKSASYIFRYMGSKEFISNIERWCLWITDETLSDAEKITEIKNRINSVREFRINAGTRAQTAVGRPHRFAWISNPDSTQIIIPTVSSERRTYIPMGFLDNKTIVSNAASIIHDPEPYVFGLISSSVHMIWVKAVAGRLEERIRYTSAICYNTFPVPELTEAEKEKISEKVYLVLEKREKFSNRSMAELYDPDKMPEELLRAHSELDSVVEGCYKKDGFKNNEEILQLLMKMYQEKTKSME